MPARYDPELGTVFDTDEKNKPITEPISDGTQAEPIVFDSPRNPLLGMAEEQAKQLELASQDAALGNAADNRPWVSGALVGDLVKAPINALAGVPTDIVDLGLGLVDVVRATAGSAGLPEQFGGMEWNQVFDDRDNPLTGLRRDTVGKMDTKTGALINQGLRLAGAVVGFKWLYKAPQVANRVIKISNLVRQIPGISKAYRSAGATQKLASGLNAANRASRGRAVFSQAVKNPYLTTTFKTIADLPETAGWWKGTVKATRSLVGTKITPRNLAETVAWDLFTSFNTFGEGEDDLDETLFDFADSIGIPVYEPLLQSPLDTSIARKAKGMLDGTLFAGAGGLLIDLFRVQRFRQAFDAATPAEKKDIVRAFKDSAEDLGNGIGPELQRVQAALSREIGMQGPDPMYGPNPMQGPLPMQGPDQLVYGPEGPMQGPNPMQGPAEPPAIGADFYLDTVNQAARIDEARALQEGVDLSESAAVANTYKVAQAAEVQAEVASLFARSGARVDDLTISPGGISRAVEESLALGVPPEEIVKNVRRMLPKKRVGLIDYIQMNPPRKNEVGMLSAADQMWSDYIIGTGLNEGWARLGPDFKPVFVRSIAREQDISGLLTKQAEALDELQRLRDFQVKNQAVREQSGYKDGQPLPRGGRPEAGNEEDLQAALQAKEIANANAGQLDPQVQARLATMEGRTQGVPIDQAEAQRLADAEMPVDPAVADAEVRSVDAALNANALTDEEFARRADEVTAENPNDLIRQFEGVDPEDLGVEIQRAETGRGWIVYGPDGEPIQNGRFTTRRAAQKAADAETNRLRQALAERAQQRANDETGEVLSLADSDVARDGTLTGKVALTQPQINELIRYPNFRPIFDQFGVKKKTYEFTQGDMADLVDGARALLQTGEVKGPRARVLTKLIDKFDTAIQKLEPDVRAARQADSIIAETRRVTNHGDYC